MGSHGTDFVPWAFGSPLRSVLIPYLMLVLNMVK